MKIKLVTVGKTVESYLKKGIELYAERMKHYASFEIVELPDLKQTSSLSQVQIKSREGDLILKAVRPQDYLILLDERGSAMTSVEWARDLESKTAHLSRDIVFVIGGPYGFSDEVYSRCDSKLSLSKMTFSHQLVRLIFMEQIYRAFTIIKGEPYHHE